MKVHVNNMSHGLKITMMFCKGLVFHNAIKRFDHVKNIVF